MDYRDRKPHKCKRKYQNELIPRTDTYLKFVFHEHDAWKHHYDFRFMLGGALRDFVVPEGPSTDPEVKRHAFSYHDHDKSCLLSEHSGDGRKGAIIRWDEGYLRPVCSEDVCQEEAIWMGLDDGYLEFELLGKKLKGRWKLYRAGKDWCLQKIDDEYASGLDVRVFNRSVSSGKTLSEMYLKPIFWLELLEFYILQQETHQIIHRDGIVLDRNQLTRTRGIDPGLELSKAKAILKEAEYLPWEAEKYFRRQTQWLDICTQFSNRIEPAHQHQAWVDLSMHPDPTATAEELVRKIVWETGLQVRSGLSATKWVAQLAAKYPGVGIDAQQNPKEFVAGLHIRELLPIAPETRERLSFLGYGKIGEVAEIPFLALQEQFGTDSYRIQAAANGGVFQPVEAAYPPESCIERFSFEGRAESAEVIQNGLTALAELVGNRLELQNLEGTKMALRLEFEDAAPRVLKRNFSKPIRDARSALVGMSLLLENELDQPLLSVQILISELRKTRVAQGAFLEAKGERIPRRLDAAIERTRTVYGDKSVQRGQDLRPPRRVLVLREWKHATGWH